MSELKPCPYCGGDAKRKSIGKYRVIKGRGQSYLATVGCRSCNGKATSAAFDRETAWEYAEETWNRRVLSWVPVSERLPEKKDIYFVIAQSREKKSPFKTLADYDGKSFVKYAWCEVISWLDDHTFDKQEEPE